MKISLSTVDLSIGYQDKKNNVLVAQNINIKMALGKLVALVGPNGAGKSTLLRTLSGIQKPISGAVFLEDKNLLDFNNTALAKKVSVVLTEKLPPSNLSVYELVSLGRQPHTNWMGRLSQDDKQQIEDAISTTQINHLRDKKHYELSDGQLQKVMIARALAQNTPLIIFDEPTTHLDLEHKVFLLALLQKLAHKAHKTILFSTHDIDLAIQLCDEIILMNKGFIQQDTPSNLMLNNHFDLLFESPNIRFDNQKQTFVLL
jgi:iron complex transport system ATP-binding protein